MSSLDNPVVVLLFEELKKNFPLVVFDPEDTKVKIAYMYESFTTEFFMQKLKPEQQKEFMALMINRPSEKGQHTQFLRDALKDDFKELVLEGSELFIEHYYENVIRAALRSQKKSLKAP